jgi:hypothetical protein
MKDMKNRGPGYRSQYAKEVLIKTNGISKEVKRINQQIMKSENKQSSKNFNRKKEKIFEEELIKFEVSKIMNP